MKKLFILCGLAAGLLISSAATAQKSGIHFGLKAGVNGNKLDGVSFDDGFAYSYLLGGFIQVPFAGKLSLQPEVLFVQSKTTTSDNTSQPFNANNPANKDIKLDYMTIPVLLNYGGAFKLQVGPQYSILMNKSNTLLSNGQEAFKSGDFSAVGGFQYALPVFGLHVGGRYVIGLTDVNDLGSSDKWKSQSVQVSAGIIF